MAGLMLAAASPSAAQIPGEAMARTMDEVRTEWTATTRAMAGDALQDWINLLERGRIEELGSFFTDGAVLLQADGARAEGRDSIRALLSRAGGRSGTEVQLARVAAGNRLMHVSGRVRYRDEGGERSETMVALLEQHHGRWLFRMLSMAPVPEALAGASMPSDALRPNRRHVSPPQRMMLRLVVEPMVAREYALEEGAGEGWSAVGGGVGVELNRTLELRGFAWQDRAGVTDPTRAYGAELRASLFELWRLRPQVAVGATRFQGGAAPDTAWVPSVGGGLAVRLTSGIDLQLSARSYLVAEPDGVQTGAWLTEKRAQRPLVGASLSLALGRRPRWQDAPPTEMQRVYEASHSPGVMNSLERWAAGLGGSWTALEAVHTPGVALYAPGEVARRGPAEVAEFWSALPAGEAAISVDQLHISGEVAYAAVRLERGGEAWDVFTVLGRDGERWLVESQAVHPR